MKPPKSYTFTDEDGNKIVIPASELSERVTPVQEERPDSYTFTDETGERIDIPASELFPKQQAAPVRAQDPLIPEEPPQQASVLQDIAGALVSGANSSVFNLGDNIADLVSPDAGDYIRNRQDGYRERHPYLSMGTDFASSLLTGGALAKGGSAAVKAVPIVGKYLAPLLSSTALPTQVLRGVTGATASTIGETDSITEGIKKLPENAAFALGAPLVARAVGGGIGGVRNIISGNSPLPASEEIGYILNNLEKSGYSPDDIGIAKNRLQEAINLNKPVNVIEALQGDIGAAGALRKTSLLQELKAMQHGSEGVRKKIIDEYRDKVGSRLQKRLSEDLERIYPTKEVMDKFKNNFDDTSFVSKNIIEAAKSAASLELAPLYKQAFRAPLKGSDEAFSKLESLAKTKEFKSAIKKTQDLFSAQSQEFSEGNATEYFHTIKSFLGNRIEELDAKVGGGGESATVKKMFGTIAELLPDEVRKVDRLYSEITKKTQVRAQAQKILARTRDQKGANLASILFKNEDSRQKMQDVMNPQNYQELEKAASFENLMKEVGSALEGGSETAANQAAQSKIGSYYNKLRGILNPAQGAEMISDFVTPDNASKYEAIATSLLKSSQGGVDELSNYERRLSDLLRKRKEQDVINRVMVTGKRATERE